MRVLVAVRVRERVIAASKLVHVRAVQPAYLFIIFGAHGEGAL